MKFSNIPSPETEYFIEAVLSFERVRAVAKATVEEQDRQDALAKYNTPEAREGARKFFSATTKELGDAAVRAAEKKTKKQVAEGIVLWAQVMRDNYDIR